MPPAVHQDQVDFGKLLHFFPHQCLHGDAAVSIVRNKSDVFRLRIKRLDHPNIIFYIVLIDKSRLQFRYIHVVGKEIDRFRHPCVQSGNRILGQYDDVAADETTHHRHLHPYRIPLRQIRRPCFLSQQNNLRRMLLPLIFRKNLRHHTAPKRGFGETFAVHVFNDNIAFPSQFAIFFHIVGDSDRSLMSGGIVGADNQDGFLIVRDSK